jgi:hypothetical protein
MRHVVAVPNGPVVTRGPHLQLKLRVAERFEGVIIPGPVVKSHLERRLVRTQFLGAADHYIRAGKDFLYLLCCWTLVPSLVAFVEFIQGTTLTDEAFNARCNGVTGTAPTGPFATGT